MRLETLISKISYVDITCYSGDAMQLNTLQFNDDCMHNSVLLGKSQNFLTGCLFVA